MSYIRDIWGWLSARTLLGLTISAAAIWPTSLGAFGLADRYRYDVESDYDGPGWRYTEGGILLYTISDWAFYPVLAATVYTIIRYSLVGFGGYVILTAALALILYIVRGIVEWAIAFLGMFVSGIADLLRGPPRPGHRKRWRR